MNQNLQALGELLQTLFDPDGLGRFVRYLPDGNRIFEALPISTSHADQAMRAASLLMQHGYTQEPSFWSALLAERPRRRVDIERAASEFTIDRSRDRRRNLVLLMAGASPEDLVRINVDKEQSAIRHVIRGARFRDSVKIVSETAVSFARLTSLLAEHRPNILHLTCHGKADVISLERGQYSPVEIAADTLAELLGTFKDSLRIVVLTVVNSSSIAQRIGRQIPLTIGMEGEMNDEAAIAFSTTFYEALCYGRSVENSFTIARVHAKVVDPTHGCFALYPAPADDVDAARKLVLAQYEA